MRPSEALRVHRDEIRRVVAQNRTRNPRVFGSVLRGKDTEDSDLDLLVDPTPDTTLLDIARIQNRLQKLLGVTVDVLTPKALPVKFRDRVIAEAVPV
ncbi:MAG: nucleotidyltransferase [Betaproteobacteria bacterium RIFCSPLOWO2_02_67_12]|nr:MAG: nucleotidyltransferase [Betaproteobacteria bacterium RIFCSPLOWO2_02_67_12]OGA59336.1 MAG: nucleotidyltransferase [Betaproteobacteria bacterium RIFCSPLOWO2_12_FULL_67_28]